MGYDGLEMDRLDLGGQRCNVGPFAAQQGAEGLTDLFTDRKLIATGELCEKKHNVFYWPPPRPPQNIFFPGGKGRGSKLRISLSGYAFRPPAGPNRRRIAEGLARPGL